MKLFFLNGPRKGENIELAPPGISIGREEDNDVQLLVAGVSRYHAKITFNGSDWRIQDLGSTNGTKVNGKPIQSPVPLQENDAIAIGDQILVFGSKKPEEKEAPPAVSATSASRRSKFPRKLSSAGNRKPMIRNPLRKNRRNSNFSIRFWCLHWQSSFLPSSSN